MSVNRTLDVLASEIRTLQHTLPHYEREAIDIFDMGAAERALAARCRLQEALVEYFVESEVVRKHQPIMKREA